MPEYNHELDVIKYIGLGLLIICLLFVGSCTIGLIFGSHKSVHAGKITDRAAVHHCASRFDNAYDSYEFLIYGTDAITGEPESQWVQCTLREYIELKNGDDFTPQHE